MNNSLEILNLSAGYQPNKYILNDFHLTLQEGESIGIIGQNGCGKSTLAKAIMGMAPYTQGKVMWNGIDITKFPTNLRNNMGIAYFMQGGKVFGNLTVEENIRIALQNKKNAIFAKELEHLEQMDLNLFKDKQRMSLNASNLSGGERHLLGFVMVLLGCPDMKLLIADEPSAGVDVKIQGELLKLIKQTTRDKNISLLLVEQNVHFLKTLTNNIISITN